MKNIFLEQKSALLFGSGAFLLSMGIGFISGVRWNVVLLRSAIITAVFAGIGFGICMILKKFVPEFYEALAALSNLNGSASDDGAAGSVESVNGGGEGVPQSSEGEVQPLTAPEEFRELDRDDLAGYTTLPGGGEAVNTRAGKLGKHILEKEKLAKYEPKIMAQAVRTMMNRERE